MTTDTLQREDGAGVSNDDESTELDSQTTEENSGAELAPAPGENQTKNENGEDDKGVNQEKINAAINRQHAKYREEERKRLAAEEEAKALKEKLAKYEADDEIVVPEPPDPFDENYAELIAARDEAIRLKAEQDANKQKATEQIKANEQEAEQASAEAFNAKAATYQSRIEPLGLKPDELQKAGEVVASYIEDINVVETILEHENGPLITKYLAANPLVLDELRSMNSIQAGLKIHGDIAQAASILKPKTSKAPDPLDDESGRGGGGESTSPFIKGVKFE